MPKVKKETHSPTPGGSATMRAKGLRPIMLSVTDDQMKLLKQAAASSGDAGIPLKHFCLEAAIKAAREMGI